MSNSHAVILLFQYFNALIPTSFLNRELYFTSLAISYPYSYAHVDCSIRVTAVIEYIESLGSSDWIVMKYGVCTLDPNYRFSVSCS